MDNLPRHYGTDASLDPALTRKLSAWLDANAGTGKRAREQPPEDRITRSAWFVREHDEVRAATWKLPAVKSAANCSACHTQAEQGDFNERRHPHPPLKHRPPPANARPWSGTRRCASSTG